MALISKIRSNSGLLIVVMALGLGSFLLMDMFGQKSIFGGQQTTIGSINGEKIDYKEFSAIEQNRGQNSGDPFADRAAAWNYLLEDKLVRSKSQELGLGVSPAEKQKLLFSDNQRELSSVITGIFQNPNTRRFDLSQFQSFKQNFATGQEDPNFRTSWLSIEKSVEKATLEEKYKTLVSKGLFAPSWMVEKVQQQGSKNVSFEYVKIPFSEIDDAEVTVNDADISKYLSENPKEYYNTEETRTMELFSLMVVPTAQDSANLFKQVSELANGLRTSTNDSLYLTNNGGFITTYLTDAQQTFTNKDAVDALAKGEVLDPVIETNAYATIKLIDTKVIPDSVGARHILRSATDANTLAAARKTIDSLKQLIDNGSLDFAKAAADFGQDGTASKGGDLGTFGPGAMVKPFNDLVFFEAKKGDVQVVETQFGVHLVEVTKQNFDSKIVGKKFGIFSENIVPSDETQDALFSEVNNILIDAKSIEDLKSKVESDSRFEIFTSNPVAMNDFRIARLNGTANRDMVRWAFTKGEVSGLSPEVYTFENRALYFNERYVIAGLKGIQPEGALSVAQAKDILIDRVRNQKKAEMIQSKVSGTDMAAIANQFSTDVDSVNRASFSSSFIPGIGNEPTIISAALGSTTGQVSKAILGNNGIYVIKVTDQMESPIAGTIADFRRVAASPAIQQVNSRLMSSIKKDAKIEDNRFRFF